MVQSKVVQHTDFVIKIRKELGLKVESPFCGMSVTPIGVICTANDLWGLPHLHLKELDQVQVGNGPLCFATAAFLRLAGLRGFAVIEHHQNQKSSILLPFASCLFS